VTLACGALASFIAPHGLKIGPGKTAAAWSWGVYAVVSIVLRLRAGRLADRYACLTLMSLGLVEGGATFAQEGHRLSRLTFAPAPRRDALHPDELVHHAGEP
jgi:hypothetical protein